MKRLSGKISFNLGRFGFSSHWTLSLVVSACVIILIKLGLWQQQRYQEKQQIIATYDARMTLTAQNIEKKYLTSTDFKYLPVKATGHLLDEHNFYLDSQFDKHRIGYHVLSPLRIAHPQTTILIDRGWIPQGATRNRLPSIKAMDKEVTLEGHIYYPQKGVILGENIDPTVTGWPKRIQYINFEALSLQLGEPLAPFIIRLNNDAPHGFSREWHIVNMPPQRHLAYALQWFGLAITLIIVYIVACTSRKD